MLKAVRFDQQEHRDLLDYIMNFTDIKGKKNESEAIRFLMTKGLENLKNPTPQQVQIDVDKLKAEIFQQIMTSLPALQQPTYFAQPVLGIDYDGNPPVVWPKPEEKEEMKFLDNGEDKPSKPITSSNPLVQNMLANRKR